MLFSAHRGGLTLGNTLGGLRHKQDSTLETQITQYVVVDASDAQKLTTTCRFLKFQDRLRGLSTSCGLIATFIYILFPPKVPTGINSAENQNYG